MFIIINSFLACGDSVDNCQSIYCVNGRIVQPDIITINRDIIIVDNCQFKDSNVNGSLDAYEDWRLSTADRVQDLLQQMSIQEKIGLLCANYGYAPTDNIGTVSLNAKNAINNKKMRFLKLTSGAYGYNAQAKFSNEMQAFAETQSLSIPLVFISNPSTGMGLTPDAASYVRKNEYLMVNAYPYAIGFGAIDDEEYIKEISTHIACDYMATGVRMLLGPMCDIPGEPRWGRFYDTFGTNPDRCGSITRSMIQGLQGSDDGSGKINIACTVKHFPGSGSCEGGMDSHSQNSQYSVFPGDNFTNHLSVMKKALSANPLCLMPCYSIFETNGFEPVSSHYSKSIMIDLLQNQLDFGGMITSDWSAVARGDINSYTHDRGTRAWGMEDYTEGELTAAYLHCGGDQIGMGMPSNWETAITGGHISEDELDEPASKCLDVIFRLGLFENPYVDETAADSTIASNANIASKAMQKALVLLKNSDSTLPLSQKSGTIYYDGVEDTAVRDFTSEKLTLTADISLADYIILRISGRHGTYEGLEGGVPLSFNADVFQYNHAENRHYTASEHASDIASGGTGFLVSDANQAAAKEQAEKLLSAIALKKKEAILIVCVFAPRPFIIKPYLEDIDALIVDFGCYDSPLLSALFGTDSFNFTSRLPFSIPASDEDVENAFEDLFNDEENQSFRFGAGLKYQD